MLFGTRKVSVLGARVDQLYGRKPTLKSVRTDLGFERSDSFAHI